jgi:hypothetical protein
MTEPTPNPAVANPDIDPALTNGLAQQTQQAPTEQPADVEMADSGSAPTVSIFSNPAPPHSSFQNPTNTPVATSPRLSTPSPTRTSLSPTLRPDRPAYTHHLDARTALCAHPAYNQHDYSADTHARSLVAQLTAPDCASAHAAYSAWESDEGVSESACDAASARGDEASCYCGAGEAVEVVE